MTVIATATEDHRDAEYLFHLCEQAIKKAKKAKEQNELGTYRENVGEVINLARQLFEKRYGF